MHIRQKFDCNNCAETKYIKKLGGTYCIPIREGKKTLEVLEENGEDVMICHCFLRKYEQLHLDFTKGRRSAKGT